MKTPKLTSYVELLRATAEHCGPAACGTEEAVKHWIFNYTTLHPQAPAFYIVDYSRNEYVYLSPSCGTVFDHCSDYLVKAEPSFLTTLWHKSDLEIFNEKVFPEAMGFLKKRSLGDYPNLSFSFNYRLRTKDGQWRTVLQRTTYFSTGDKGLPLAAIVFITDIS